MARHLALLPLAFALAACTPSQPPSEAPDITIDAVDSSTASTGLDAWHWQLTDAADAEGSRIDALFGNPDRPLQLDFSAGSIGVSGGCNRMGGSYTLEGDSLQIGQLAQTMMACEQALMDQDRVAASLLAGELTLTRDGGDPPGLALTTADGTRLSFTGHATAEARHGGPGEQMFLEVAAQRVACNHPLIPDMQCLQVREVSYDEDGLRQGEPGDWQPLYEDIEGFAHEPGVRNVIRVKRFERDPVPADASAIVYVHDMTVESAVE